MSPEWPRKGDSHSPKKAACRIRFLVVTANRCNLETSRAESETDGSSSHVAWKDTFIPGLTHRG